MIEKQTKLGVALVCPCCESTTIDINHWENPDTAVLRCYYCGHEGKLVGFSAGRVELDIPQVRGAIEDMARPRFWMKKAGKVLRLREV